MIYIPHFREFAELREWIKANRPDLYNELLGVRMNIAQQILNRETGLNFGPGANTATCSVAYLEALKAQQISPGPDHQKNS